MQASSTLFLSDFYIPAGLVPIVIFIITLNNRKETVHNQERK